MSGALPRPGVYGGGGGGGGSISARTSIEAGDIGRGSDGGGSGSGGSDGPASTSVDPLRLLLRATASEDARAGVKDAGGPGTMRMGPAMLQMMGATKKRPAPTAAAATQAPGSPPRYGLWSRWSSMGKLDQPPCAARLGLSAPLAGSSPPSHTCSHDPTPHTATGAAPQRRTRPRGGALRTRVRSPTRAAAAAEAAPAPSTGPRAAGSGRARKRRRRRQRQERPRRRQR